MKSTHPTLVCCHLNSLALVSLELKLLYTYSHVLSPLKDSSPNHTNRWLQSRLHNQWVQPYQFRPSFSRPINQPKMKHRRIIVTTLGVTTNSHLHITIPSYSINTFTLNTLAKSNKLQVGSKYFNPMVLQLFLLNINYLWMAMIKAHFLYSLFFASRKYNTLALFNPLLPKLTRLGDSQTSFSSVFHKMRYL